MHCFSTFPDFKYGGKEEGRSRAASQGTKPEPVRPACTGGQGILSFFASCLHVAYAPEVAQIS